MPDRLHSTSERLAAASQAERELANTYSSVTSHVLEIRTLMGWVLLNALRNKDAKGIPKEIQDPGLQSLFVFLGRTEPVSEEDLAAWTDWLKHETGLRIIDVNSSELMEIMAMKGGYIGDPKNLLADPQIVQRIYTGCVKLLEMQVQQVRGVVAEDDVQRSAPQKQAFGDPLMPPPPPPSPPVVPPEVSPPPKDPKKDADNPVKSKKEKAHADHGDHKDHAHDDHEDHDHDHGDHHHGPSPRIMALVRRAKGGSAWGTFVDRYMLWHRAPELAAKQGIQKPQKKRIVHWSEHHAPAHKEEKNHKDHGHYDAGHHGGDHGGGHHADAHGHGHH